MLVATIVLCSWVVTFTFLHVLTEWGKGGNR